MPEPSGMGFIWDALFALRQMYVKTSLLLLLHLQYTLFIYSFRGPQSCVKKLILTLARNLTILNFT